MIEGAVNMIDNPEVVENKGSRVYLRTKSLNSLAFLQTSLHIGKFWKHFFFKNLSDQTELVFLVHFSAWYFKL